MDLLERTAQRVKALAVIGGVVSAVYTIAYYFSQNNNPSTLPILTVIVALLMFVLYDLYNRVGKLERAIYNSNEEY
jgi:hypothetical protein